MSIFYACCLTMMSSSLVSFDESTAAIASESSQGSARSVSSGKPLGLVQAGNTWMTAEIDDLSNSVVNDLGFETASFMIQAKHAKTSMRIITVPVMSRRMLDSRK